MKTPLRRTIVGLSVLSIVGCSSLSKITSGDLSSVSQGVLDGTAIPDSIPNTGAELNADRIGNVAKAVKGITLSDEEVQKMCFEVAQESDRENKIASSKDPHSVRLNKLVAQHLKEDSLKLDFKVYLSPEINAFSLANGSIRVYSGLMDQMNDQELLSVIGHEIGHVKLGHSKGQMQKAYIAAAAVDAGVGELGSRFGSAGAGIAGAGMKQGGKLLKEIISAQFSQSDEEEADDYGVQFLIKHKYDSRASVHALRKLAALNEGEHSAFSALFASHPDPESRAARIESELGGKVLVASAKKEDTKSDTKTEVAVVSEDKPSAPVAAPQVEKMARLNPEAPQFEEIKVDEDSNASYDWYVQIAAPTDNNHAEELLKKVIQSGSEAIIQEATVNEALYFRVLVGPYRAKSDASLDLERVKSLGFNEGDPFIRQAN